MDIRKFFGRSPSNKPKIEGSNSSVKKQQEPKNASCSMENDQAKNKEKKLEHSKLADIKVPSTSKRKTSNGAHESEKKSPKKSEKHVKKAVHDVSSSDDNDEPEPPKRSSTKKQKISAEDFFESSSPSSTSLKKEKRSPKSRAKSEDSSKKKIEVKQELETPKSSRTLQGNSKGKSAKLEISPKETPSKKRKIDPSGENEPTHKRQKSSPSTEPSPKAKVGRPSTGNASSYLAYLNREPPRHLGEKDHPEGSPNCLKGFTIVMTGVMDYVEKDEIKRIVEHCGGKITGNISGKTTHVIAGRDAGPAKIAKAQSVGAKILEELEWLKFVESVTDKSCAFKPKEKNDPIEKVLMEIEEAEAEAEKVSRKKEKGNASRKERSPADPRQSKKAQTHDPEAQPSTSTTKSSAAAAPSLMWVDKYTPSSTKQIIGQQGSQSNVAKLKQWLSQWSTKLKPPFNKFKNPTGAGLRAALLSGPPGVGKTTSAHLVCRELGFEVIEMNASDTRSKRSLKEEVATLLNNRTLNSAAGEKGHVLIMDEVDGMSGNEDRGGMQELIHLIKHTMVPIICICNDRSHQKMRTLVNYCFDLRFYKPQSKQILASLMSLCFKEGVKVSQKTLEEIIVGSNQDIRQCVHTLNLFCAMSGSNTKQQVTKDVKIGPFDVVKKLLVSAEGETLDLNERQSLFFNDYNSVPLFIQENYVKVQPKNTTKKRDLLQRLSDSSEAICIGDTVERQIRSSNAWALLPVQAMYSAVIPSLRMQGTMRQMVNFPGWFGKNSTTGKHAREAQALNAHMKCVISGDTFETTTQYLPLMVKRIMRPLLKEGEAGVAGVVDFMDTYSLQRADVDAILELTSWNSQEKDPFAEVPSKVKAKLTRSLNKSQMLRYATDDMIKTKGKKLKKEKIENDDEMNDDLQEELESVDFD